MQRIMDFLDRHTSISEESADFIRAHGKIACYSQLSHFMRPHERKPYWCLLLEGLVCGYVLDEAGNRAIRWIAEPLMGFAGVRHLYTPKKSGHYIQFLQDSQILSFPASAMRQAKEQFSEVSEMLHILNQRHKDRQDAHIALLQQPTAYARFDFFRNQFASLTEQTTADQQMDFMRIGKSQYYEAQKRWLKKN